MKRRINSLKRQPDNTIRHGSVKRYAVEPPKREVLPPILQWTVLIVIALAFVWWVVIPGIVELIAQWIGGTR